MYCKSEKQKQNQEGKRDKWMFFLAGQKKVCACAVYASINNTKKNYTVKRHIFHWWRPMCFLPDDFFRLNSRFNVITGKNSSTQQQLSGVLCQTSTKKLPLVFQILNIFSVQFGQFGYQYRICNETKLIELTHMEKCQVETELPFDFFFLPPVAFTKPA